MEQFSNSSSQETETIDGRTLASVPLFRHLDAECLARLAQLLEAQEFEAGDVVMHEYDVGDAMYIVGDGSVRVWTHDAQAQAVTLAVIEANGFFGELAVIDGAERSATVTVLERSKLWRLSRQSFRDFVLAEPTITLGMLAELSERLRATNRLVAKRTVRNINDEMTNRMTIGERIADRVATFGGSWTFIGIFAGILMTWIGLNIYLMWRVTNGGGAFDPYPFIALNLVLSMMAAFQAPVIMMSQNAAAIKDRLAAENDYQVNLKSELMLEELTRRMERLQNSQMEELLRVVNRNKDATPRDEHLTDENPTPAPPAL